METSYYVLHAVDNLLSQDRPDNSFFNHFCLESIPEAQAAGRSQWDHCEPPLWTFFFFLIPWIFFLYIYIFPQSSHDSRNGSTSFFKLSLFTWKEFWVSWRCLRPLLRYGPLLRSPTEIFLRAVPFLNRKIGRHSTLDNPKESPFLQSSSWIV